MKKILTKIIWALPITIAMIIAIVGPLPTPEIFHQRPYQFGRLDYELRNATNLATTNIRRGEGELEVGVGVRNIDPENGQPLMGFVNSGKSRGVVYPSFAKALSIKCGETTITVLTLDIFILLPRLTNAVIAASGLSADEIYFTASHTHHSVGGWADGIIEQLVYGRYSQRYFDKLVEQISSAIRESRQNFVPAFLGYRRAFTNGLTQNRIYPERPAREIIDALIFRRRDNNFPIATLITFSAHSTTMERKDQRASADYSGVWRDLWEKDFGGVAMFAAGYVGDARANSAMKVGDKLTEPIGEKLAEFLQAAPEISVPVKQIASLRVPILSPVARLPLGANWRWFPLFLPRYYPRQTHLSVLKIGGAAMVGFPADFAGELAPSLERAAEKSDLKMLVTSFNGDWRGYFITPETFYGRKSYERRMAISGAEAGAMFTEIAVHAIKKISAQPAPQ